MSDPLVAKQEAIVAVIDVRERFVRLIISLATGFLALPPLLIEKNQLPGMLGNMGTVALYAAGVLTLCGSIGAGLIWILTSPDLIKHAYGQGKLAKRSSKSAERRMNWSFNWMIGLVLTGGLLSVTSAWIFLSGAAATATVP